MKRETAIERRYRLEGQSQGLTVEQWERAEMLPRYTVCPNARDATGPDDFGWFMYRNQDEKERATATNRSNAKKRDWQRRKNLPTLEWSEPLDNSTSTKSGSTES